MGELDRSRALLNRLLERRFGSLPDELRARIEAMDDVELLRAYSDQAIDISALGELSL